MRKQPVVPQKGFSVWVLKKLGQTPSVANVLAVRLIIILLCVIGIFITRADADNADEFGNYQEMQERYPDQF